MSKLQARRMACHEYLGKLDTGKLQARRMVRSAGTPPGKAE